MPAAGRRRPESGSIFTATEHTSKHFRSELWEPELFSRESYNAWVTSGKKTEIDKAKEKAESILKEDFVPGIDEATERALRDVIKTAEKTLPGNSGT